jgi:deoxyribodipyrimidine photo-lyase
LFENFCRVAGFFDKVERDHMDSIISPSSHTRSGALAAWEEFLPRVKLYAWKRNEVEVGHRNVSRLSPALRYRLLLEDELIQETQQKYNFSTTEKWLQEICWRRYWKGWLEMRPQVWSEWRQRVSELRASLPQKVLDHAEAVAAGESGVACMDLIARELIETGYLHNHARMWWASFWIHAEGLPWELGADFFYRHLLDADPASNTLSWRWVAGLQTPGKTYLVRLSNLEKYAKTALLGDLTGSQRIADGVVKPAAQAFSGKPAQTPLPAYPTALGTTHERAGLWLHSDDLAPEIGPLAAFTPVAVAAFTGEQTDREEFRLSEKHLALLKEVTLDGLARAGAHYRCPATLVDGESLAEWASSQQLTEVVAFAPTVGPMLDLLPRLTTELSTRGIQLTLVRRPSDAHAFALAGSGFFGFWEKMSKHLQRPLS